MRALVRVAASTSLAAGICLVAPTVGGVGLTAAQAVTASPTITPISCSPFWQKADGKSWSCTFDDEFSATKIDRTKWAVSSTYFATGSSTGPHACYADNPSVVSESGGALHLSMTYVTTPVSCLGWSPTNYVGGSVSTYHLFSQEYGRVEIRARDAVEPTGAVNETYWMWPDDRYTTINWPQTGEMDIAQNYSSDPANTYPFLHYGTDQWLAGTTIAACSAPRGQWNTYDLQWDATQVNIYVNGQLCLHNESADPAFNERYIVALTQAIDTPTSSTVFPITSDIDYVRVWKSR